MPPLYPLTFRPVFKRYLWGGRRLLSVLDKPIGEGDDYAESWEVADHAAGQSVVANGPLAGTTLHQLVVSRGSELLGRHAPQSRFPLLFKYLDCQRDLSVQVHPSDAVAARLDPPDLGKTEAWVVVEARPGSRLFAGLKRGYDRQSLVAALGEGRLEGCLHEVEPRAGDCVFIRAGTVHALGAGLVVAEIQQASDTTYRLYDWGRVGPDGQPRKLHIEESLAVTDFAACEIRPQQPQATAQPHVERLVHCDKFVLDRLTLNTAAPIGGDERFHIVSVLNGELAICATGPEPELTLAKGQTVLLPACLKECVAEPRGRAVALDMYLPD
jgi:mannose-6-phosphate isomerase